MRAQAPAFGVDLLVSDPVPVVSFTFGLPDRSVITATIPQVTLAWLLARFPAVMPIPATTSASHLRENLAARDLELTGEHIRLIDGLAPDHAA